MPGRDSVVEVEDEHEEWNEVIILGYRLLKKNNDFERNEQQTWKWHGIIADGPTSVQKYKDG